MPDGERRRPAVHHIRARPDARRWLSGLAWGALCGAVVLGVGGRVAMRGVALVQEWTPYFTVEGSITVVVMGTLAGVAGAAIALVIASVPRLSGLARTVVYCAAAALLTWRILQPVDRDRVMMFAPVTIVYSVVLLMGFARPPVRLRRARASMAPPAVVADAAD